MACYYYSFQKKKTICKFVIFNEDSGSGSGWGGWEGLNLFWNFQILKKIQRRGGVGLGREVISCMFLSLCLEQNDFPRRHQNCVHWELNNISGLYLFQSCRDS